MDKTTETPTRAVINCRGIELRFQKTPLIMGILNVTPDSFSDGGEYFKKERAVERALEMVEGGAHIIDVGGESTRPGSDPVSPEEELSRVVPVLEELVGNVSVPISIDTRRAQVAEEAMRIGCHLVNDVSACRDGAMPEVLCKYNAPVVIMHMKGEPKTMQLNPTYGDVVSEIRAYLGERADALKKRGVPGESIVIDPGIGFGKRFRDNLELLHRIDELRSLGYPVLIGASRKRFLGELLGAESRERLSGSLAVAAWCFSRGVELLRVHDVKETAQLIRVLDAVANPRDYSACW